MVVTFAVRNANIIDCADCEYALLEVLQFDHVFGIRSQVTLFNLVEPLGSCIGLQHVFVIDGVSTECHNTRYAYQVGHLLQSVQLGPIPLHLSFVLTSLSFPSKV